MIIIPSHINHASAIQDLLMRQMEEASKMWYMSNPDYALLLYHIYKTAASQNNSRYIRVAYGFHKRFDLDVYPTEYWITINLFEDHNDVYGGCMHVYVEYIDWWTHQPIILQQVGDDPVVNQSGYWRLTRVTL